MGLLSANISFYSLSLIHPLKIITEVDKAIVTQTPKILSMTCEGWLLGIDSLFCLENKITVELLGLINEEIAGALHFLCQGKCKVLE